MRDKIIIGDKIKVLDDLITTIIKIENEKYYFRDEDNKIWYVGIEDLQIYKE